MKHIVHRNTKTIFESDNNLFCLLTMNSHPVHTNEEYAKKTKHGKILVNGTYVFSLAIGLMVPELSFESIATLEYDRIIHYEPVFIGDTICVETEIQDEKLTSKGKFIVTSYSTVYNQKGKVVMSFWKKGLFNESFLAKK